MTKQSKTNIARILDRAGVGYELRTHAVDESDLSAERVAREMGVDTAMLYKTLVLRGEPLGVLVCLVEGDKELDLKLVASLSGNKRVELIGAEELQPITGYIRGGCSPIGMKRSFLLYIDESALRRERIFINGGARGSQLLLSSKELIELTSAFVAKLVK